MTKPRIVISVSLYIMVTLSHYIKDETFLNMFFTALFSPNLSRKLKVDIEEYPNSPKNYFLDWNAQKKSSSNISFVNYVSSNFSEPFIRSLIYQGNSPYPEVLAIVKKYEKLSEDIQNPKFFEVLLADILGKFSNSDLDMMTAYHKNISIATGHNVGLSVQDNSQFCIMKVMEKMFLEIQVIKEIILVKQSRRFDQK